MEWNFYKLYIFSCLPITFQMRLKFLFLLASLSLIFTAASSSNAVSNCLGNCIACDYYNPLLCRNLLNSTSGKEYTCLPYYTGSSCQQTVNSYYNMYNETGTFFNWSLPSPPPVKACKLIPPSNANSSNYKDMSFSSIGPFSASLNATKSLSFAAAQNIQRLILKISVAVADAALYNGSIYSNQTTTETTDAEGNIIIETVTTTNQNASLAKIIPFVNLAVTNQLNSNSLIASFSTSYSSISITNTSCGFVYQYQFVVDALSTNNPFRQTLLNFYLSTPNSMTTWYLLSFTAEGGCSGFAVSSNSAVCSTCLSGFYAVNDPDGALQSCSICDYRCSTCSSASVCLLCEAYTTSPVAGICQYPQSYGVYRKFNAITGRYLNLSSASNSQFSSVASSQAQSLNLGLELSNNQSYLIKFYLLYSLNYAQNLNQLSITVNGQPYTSYSTLDTLTSTLLQEGNNAAAQLYATAIKIDLIGKPCKANFSIGFKGSSQANEEFFVANMVLVQYSCGENCLTCMFSTSQISTCTQCMPFFSLAQNCKTCANGFYLRDSSICVKCYSNCKQCIGPALNQCTDCLTQFTLGELTFDQDCIPCLYNFWDGRMTDCNSVCPHNFTLPALKYSVNCTVCFQIGPSQKYSSAACLNCWVTLGLSSGKCVPLISSGYVFYSNDLPNGHANSSLWQGSQALSTLNCTNDYINLYGIPQAANHSTKNPSTLTYTLSGLPTHRGIIMVLNIFKVDDWLGSASQVDNNTTFVINIAINSPGYQGNTFNLSLTNSYGSNICGNSGREMIWTVQSDLNDHAGSQVIMTITAPDEGILVREVEVYLGNCPQCELVGLSYTVFAIPMYSDNSTQTGLDTWITFNHPVYYTYQNNQSQADVSQFFANSFKFSIDGIAIPNAVLIDNNIAEFNYIKYFLPLSQSYTNGTLTANTSYGDLVYTTDGSVSRQLVSSSQTYQVQRFDDASLDTRRSISQLSGFFHFFTWFTLIFMIICVMLGVGVVFEEFSIMLQLIYYHIYITSALLPPSIKVPLSNAVRMQHLNYFADIGSIENNLFGDLSYPADYIFQQYNVDVYFLRSFYPILIINAIYIGWFLINLLLYHLLTPCKQSQHKLFRFLRSIPQRPLAYLDQIWRYQFLATMWACMINFTDFQSNGGQVISLIICILALVVSIVWPFVVTIYTYRRHYVMNVNHFRYCYHDLYYLKISSVADEPKSYLYVGIRFGKLLAYAIFIALFINQSIIGPVLLIFFNIIEGVMAYFLKIYRSSYYLFTRIVQNLLLCIAAILCLIVFANASSMSQESFENLGYGISTVFVLMVINGICRFFYLIYKKVYEWKIGTYDIGEVGEKQNYDEKGPIRLAESERV